MRRQKVARLLLLASAWVSLLGSVGYLLAVVLALLAQNAGQREAVYMPSQVALRIVIGSGLLAGLHVVISRKLSRRQKIAWLIALVAAGIFTTPYYLFAHAARGDDHTGPAAR
jgi:hypothetical protein